MIRGRDVMIGLRFFAFLKTDPGREIETATRIRSIPKVNRVLLIPEFGLLAQFNYAKLENRERQVREVHERIGEIAPPTNTRIICVESHTEESSPDLTLDTFTLIRAQHGRVKEILTRLLQSKDIKAVHRLLDEDDLFIQVTGGGLNEIATIIQKSIGKIEWISDVERFIPKLELDILSPVIQVST